MATAENRIKITPHFPVEWNNFPESPPSWRWYSCGWSYFRDGFGMLSEKICKILANFVRFANFLHTCPTDWVTGWLTDNSVSYVIVKKSPWELKGNIALFATCGRMYVVGVWFRLVFLCCVRGLLWLQVNKWVDEYLTIHLLEIVKFKLDCYAYTCVSI